MEKPSFWKWNALRGGFASRFRRQIEDQRPVTHVRNLPDRIRYDIGLSDVARHRLWRR